MVFNKRQHYDVAVVGGGIAGLTAAALLSQSGKSVILLEQGTHPGGRATTQAIDGYHFNLGPHALYRGGHAIRVLRELGIEVSEPPVGTSGSVAVLNKTIHSLPVGALSLMSTSLFSLRERLEMLRILGELPRIDTRPVQGTTLSAWLDARSYRPVVRQFVEALIRVSTYTNDPERISAGAAFEQIQKTIRNGVTYLSGGWQTLIDRIRRSAESSGTVIHLEARVHGIANRFGEVRGVYLQNGTLIDANAVILAVPPETAASLLEDPMLDFAIPVQAACLDLALRKLPDPGRTFALGVDEPMYYSVHSRWASLAPAGRALVQVAKYLPAGIPSDAAASHRELEAFVDLVQPGWRNEILHQRFFPTLTVTHAVVTASAGGLRGRPAVESSLRNVYLAGDWVGDEGMLADASFASAHRAAQLIVGNMQSMLQTQAV